MEEDYAVRKIVETIFAFQHGDIAETAVPDSCVPACLMERNFKLGLQKVMNTKQFVTLPGWVKFFNAYSYKMLVSHVDYLTYIMVACKGEYDRHQNVFEGFISTCAVVGNLNSETREKTGMNFCGLNSDIIMEFYDNLIKIMFLKRGGFQQFVEHILGHRYLEWDTPDVHTTDKYNGAKKLKEEMLKESLCISGIDPHGFPNRLVSVILAQEVIGKTKDKLPALLSKRELVVKLVACRESEMEEIAKIKSLLEAKVLKQREENDQACTNSNLDIETSNVPKQKEDIARYERIILAVTRYNRSKSSDLVLSDNGIQKQADRILKRLKHSIESLIEILDKYDKE